MRRLLLSGLLAAAYTFAACGDNNEPTGAGGNGGGAVASIVVVSGDGQRVAVSRSTLVPLVVKVANAQAGGVAGQTVSWAVTSGGGSTSAVSSTTNANGEASVSFTAGPGGEDNVISATVAGLPAVTFTVKAVEPAAVVVSSGDGQDARISQPLAQALEVRVTAADNGPVPNLPVAWMVMSGGGSLASASTVTNADGRASNGLTLGAMPGANSATATPSGLAAVTFNAVGSTPISVKVDMQGIAFVAPGGGDDVTIMLGDTVRWENLDGVQHTATSNSTPSGGMSFDSGLLNQAATFTFVPNTRGEWIYFCEVHPLVMRDARIRVE